MSNSGNSAGAFVGISVPIFYGGLRDSMQLQAQQRVEAAQARLDRVRQEAVQQIVVAQNAARSRAARWPLKWRRSNCRPRLP